MDQTPTQFPSPAPLAAQTIRDHHPNPHLVDPQHPHFDLHHHVPALPPPGPAEPRYSIPTLPSHGNIGNLGGLDGADSSAFHLNSHNHSLPHLQRLQEPPIHQQPHQLSASPHATAATAAAPPPPPPSSPPSHANDAQYGMLTPHPAAVAPNNTVAKLRQDNEYLAPSGPLASPSTPEPNDNRSHGKLVYRIVADPPDLKAWREKLFSVDDTILLTNDEFETYFPHIDNVYSHRSTQRYKRKPFVSHYWDCRMKGRPPGTPKSDDPSKKKRKRNARERDLCDVKIKITEYFPGASPQPDDGVDFRHSGSGAYSSPQHQHYSAGGLLVHPGMNGEKFWTIQRVNGNGGNGKGDGVAGPHKHTLAKSDEIKKSSVQRHLDTQEKVAKRMQKPMQRRTTGHAQNTARKHAKDHELKLYAACFCPFSQRVWIALEAKGMEYQYCETDPYKRPTQLLEANPNGTVPAIREGDWASGESAIILEYLEDQDQGVPLFPTDPRLKANCRLWIEHINVKIVPSYLALLRADDVKNQAEHLEKLETNITALVQAADERGPYFLGGDMCLVDIHFAPFVLRLSRILRELRGWTEPSPGTRWHRWVEALEQNRHVQATTSNKELYVDTSDLLLGDQHTHGTGVALPWLQAGSLRVVTPE